MRTFYRVEHTRHNIVAGMEVEKGIVIKTAPILKWCKGIQFGKAEKALKKKGYKISIISSF